MPGIQNGKALTCNDLFIHLYDYCQDPPVLSDPYEIYYSISKIDSILCSEEVIVETIDSEPLKAGIGKYYVPELPILEDGKYKIRWKFRETEDCTLKEACVEFTLYSLAPCIEAKGFRNRCSCWNNGTS